MEGFAEKIKKYYGNEYFSAREYKRMAEKSSNPRVKLLYEQLSMDEERHQKILKAILELKSPEEREVLKDLKVEDVDLKPQRSKFRSVIEEAYNYMEWHLRLEADATKAYETMMNDEEDEVIKMLWQKLYSDEKRHHRIIGLLMKTFREMYGSVLSGR